MESQAAQLSMVRICRKRKERDFNRNNKGNGFNSKWKRKSKRKN